MTKQLAKLLRSNLFYLSEAADWINLLVLVFVISHLESRNILYKQSVLIHDIFKKFEATLMDYLIPVENCKC